MASAEVAAAKRQNELNAARLVVLLTPHDIAKVGDAELIALLGQVANMQTCYASVKIAVVLPAHYEYRIGAKATASSRYGKAAKVLVPATKGSSYRRATYSEIAAEVTRRKLFSSAEMSQWYTIWNNNVARLQASSGGFFSGFTGALNTVIHQVSNVVTTVAEPVRGIANKVVDNKIVKQVGRATVNAATLGNGNAVIHAGQVVARNPYVQAAALATLTVATGGAAAAALGGGMLGAAGGAMIAGAASGKVTGSTFNLQQSLIGGATAGIGQGVKGLELVRNAGANAALIAAGQYTMTSKLNGTAFNLKQMVLQGASAGLPAAGGNFAIAGKVLSAAQTVQQAKAAYAMYKLSKQQGAQAAADKAELEALMAELNAMQQSGNVAHQQQIAQAILDKPVIKTTTTTTNQQGAMKVAAGGLIALKLLAFI